MKTIARIECLNNLTRKFKLVYPTTMLSVLALSCGSKGSNETPTGINKETAQLAGSWHSDCHAGTFLASSHVQKKIGFNVAGGFKRETRLFDNAQCSGPKVSTVLNGTFAAVGDVPNEPDAKQLNLTAKSAFVTPLDDKNTADFNQSKYCGITDWITNVEREVTGLSCYSGFKEGQVIFDIYRIQENHIYFGNTGIWLNGGSDEQRPQKLDLSDPLAKQ